MVTLKRYSRWYKFGSYSIAQKDSSYRQRYHFATIAIREFVGAVPERDENTEAVRNVEKATDSEPVKGEELLESEELRRKLAEAKKQIKSERRPTGS